MPSCAPACRSWRWSFWASRPSARGRNGAGAARAASRSSSGARGRGCGSTTRKVGAAGSRISSAAISAWRATMRPTGSPTGSAWRRCHGRLVSDRHQAQCAQTIRASRQRHRPRRRPRATPMTMPRPRRTARTRPPSARPGSGPAPVPPRPTTPISPPSRQSRSPCAWTWAAASSFRCRTSTAGSTVSRPSRRTGPSVSWPAARRRGISRWWVRTPGRLRSPQAPS